MKRFLRVAIGVGLLSIFAACSQDVGEEGTGETVNELSADGWTTIGFGVTYKKVGDGDNALLVYGGYLAQDAWSQGWAAELARVKGDELSIGHVYAIRGPNQSGYANREIGNSKLAEHLSSQGIARRADKILVLAHSSGTFVSDELARMMKAETHGIPSGTIGKVDLYNLDGGGGSDSATNHALKSLTYVWACDRSIGRCSHNAEGMKAAARGYKGFEVDANGSGCSRSSAGGLWCLHDTLVTNKPHNPDMYDLARDYTDFAGSRRVITSYLGAPSSWQGDTDALIAAQ